MTGQRRISSMSFRSAASPLSRADLDNLLKSDAFGAFLGVLSDAMIVIDSDDNILRLNPAAEKLFGVTRNAIEGRPLESFLKHTSLGLDEWLSAASRGRVEAVLHDRDGKSGVQASRRVIPVEDSKRPYVLLTFGTRRAALTHSDPASVTASGLNSGNLIFSPDLSRKIDHAIKAHTRKVRILLLGESGVGKTAIAKHVHLHSAGESAPFVHVNCGSIPETLFESELFGYERGAFTGALQAGKRGFIENAVGGTLFLDEIGEMPLASQAKLLKFLEDGTIQPVGANLVRRVDTTVISATNRDLRAMVREKKFRSDLFYRIATFPITVPALRNRTDKEEVLDSFLRRLNQSRKPPLSLSKECRRWIINAPLHGNMRELRSMIDYLDIVVDEVAEPGDLENHFEFGDAPLNTGDAFPVIDLDSDLKSQVIAFENNIIARAIGQFGSKREAARKLGIDVATLIRKQIRED
jgi:PAS domain S-box-containing protein